MDIPPIVRGNFGKRKQQQHRKNDQISTKATKDKVIAEKIPENHGENRSEERDMSKRQKKRKRNEVSELQTGAVKFMRQEQNFRSGIGARPPFPFVVDEADHCETGAQAYTDLFHLLQVAARDMGKPIDKIKIYDPYYCDGSVVRKLNSMGFLNVYNQCEDFYVKIASGEVPDYDILVTNPPYSGDHVEKLLKFAEKSTKPWFLLLPNYVYTKDFYAKSLPTSRVSYLIRQGMRYAYEPPSWVGVRGSTAIEKGRSTTAPFPSFWFCRFPKRYHKQIDPKKIYVVNSKGSEMLNHALILCTSIECLPTEVRGELDQTRKRPNPKARKRRKKRLDALRQ